ncbi:MAG TPA: response regulator [Abditibacteriaceae bacterium]|jgi:DNA-binding response OmpR family regulator
MRVLIVDDNEELREFMALCLTEAAVDAEAVGTPEEALAAIETERFNLVAVDSVLGEADGIALVEQIRGTRAGKKLPVIVMSTISTALARRMAQSAGSNEFLVKPFGQMQFIEQVKSLAR